MTCLTLALQIFFDPGWKILLTLSIFIEQFHNTLVADGALALVLFETSQGFHVSLELIGSH